MRKIIAIAAREYFAVVRSKAFLISLVLLPVMMFAPSVLERTTRRITDVRDRRFAIIDRTLGERIYQIINTAVAKRNQTKLVDPQSQRQIEPRFVLERVDPADENEDSPTSMQQRYDLADRVRRGELFGFVDVGRDVLAPPASQPATQADSPAVQPRHVPPSQVVRYYTNTPTYQDFRNLLQEEVNRAAQSARLQALGVYVEPETVLKSVAMEDRGLTRKDASGKIVESEPTSRFASIMIPLGLALLMLLVVLIGAVPMMQGIMEEKQQRIAEVLLGSVSPFQLMAGKVLGLVATSVTLIFVYLGGAYFGAHRLGVTDFLPSTLIIWFILFQILAVLMFGSLYIAIGAACTDAKEMQSLIMPINMLLVIPIALLPNIVQNPNGPLARLASLFPPATPMVAVVRLSVPPGVPVWEIAISILIVLLTTVILVWASGRVFRVGILMQGKGANLRDLMRWVVSG